MLEKPHTPAGSAAGSAGRKCWLRRSASWGLRPGWQSRASASMAAAGHGVGLRRGFCGSALAAFWKKHRVFDGLAVGRTVCGSAERSAADVRRPV